MKSNCKKCYFYSFEKKINTTRNICNFEKKMPFVIDRKKARDTICWNFTTKEEYKKKMKNLKLLIVFIVLLTLLTSYLTIHKEYFIFSLIIPFVLFFWLVINNHKSRKWERKSLQKK